MMKTSVSLTASERLHWYCLQQLKLDVLKPLKPYSFAFIETETIASVTFHISAWLRKNCKVAWCNEAHSILLHASSYQRRKLLKFITRQPWANYTATWFGFSLLFECHVHFNLRSLVSTEMRIVSAIAEKWGIGAIAISSKYNDAGTVSTSSGTPILCNFSTSLIFLQPTTLLVEALTSACDTKTHYSTTWQCQD